MAANEPVVLHQKYQKDRRKRSFCLSKFPLSTDVLKNRFKYDIENQQDITGSFEKRFFIISRNYRSLWYFIRTILVDEIQVGFGLLVLSK
jgi:hypothetical protein